MRFQNASIRSKLLASNLIMAIVPIVVIAVVSAVFLGGVLSFFVQQSSGRTLQDMLSLYRLQSQVSSLEKELLQAGESQEALRLLPESELPDDAAVRPVPSGKHKLLTQQVLARCAAMQQTGRQLAVVIDGDMVYLTENVSEEAFLEALTRITGETADTGNRLVFAEFGTALCTAGELPGGSMVQTAVLMPLAGNGGNAFGVLRSERFMRSVDYLLAVLIFLTLAVILAADAAIVFVVSRSVLLPMRMLQTAVQEMREGNLDCPVEYHAKNEIGQVCDGVEQLRQRLKDSEDAQKRFDEARKDVIAGLSHDLGTPLTSIKGYASGLLDGIAVTPEKQARYLQTIYETADDLDKLVGEFAMFARLDMDVMPYYFAEDDIIHFLEKCRFEMEELFEKNNTLFTWRSGVPGKEVFIRMDQVQLKRVCVNLMDNCVKYKRTDNQQSRAMLTIDLMNAKTLRVVMESNGKTVTPEDCEKIFDTFYRSTTARTEVLNGSGLGLAVCRKIMEQHGGTIQAKVSSMGGLAVECQFPIVRIETKKGV